MPIAKLSPHFTFHEMTYSQTAAWKGINNTPSPEVIEELMNTCNMLEKIREVLGYPIIVTSGYRSHAVNRAVGGVEGSHHGTGQACDFICPEFGNPISICMRLEPMVKELGIDQLIHEFDSWVHVSQTKEPRCMCLTINNHGTRTGFA
jgi:hypothetical protein